MNTKQQMNIILQENNKITIKIIYNPISIRFAIASARHVTLFALIKLVQRQINTHRSEYAFEVAVTHIVLC